MEEAGVFAPAEKTPREIERDKIIATLETEAICLDESEIKTKEALWSAVTELRRIHNLEIISTEVLRQVQDTAIDKAREMEQEYRNMLVEAQMERD